MAEESPKLTKAYALLLSNATQADKQAGRATVPTHTIRVLAATLGAGRCAAWTQGPTESRLAYLFRMCVLAHVYPEALAVFYDNYWRYTRNAYRGIGEKRALQRGGLKQMLQADYGSAVRVQRPLANVPLEPEGRPLAVFVAPFIRGPLFGEDAALDTARVREAVLEADQAAHVSWQQAVQRTKINQQDRAYFITADRMLAFMSTTGLMEPASRYDEATELYATALERYIAFRAGIARQKVPLSTISQPATDDLRRFFANPPATVSEPVRQAMGQLLAPPAAGAAQTIDVELAQQLLGQLDIVSLYVQTALRNADNEAAVIGGVAGADGGDALGLATLIVETLSDAISVALCVAPRTVQPQMLDGLAKRLLLIFYGNDADAMRQDFLTPWYRRPAAATLDVPAELIATMVVRGTRNDVLQRDLGRAKREHVLSPAGKKAEANIKRLFNVPQAEFEAVQAVRRNDVARVLAPAAGAASAVVKRRTTRKTRVGRKRKGALVMPAPGVRGGASSEGSDDRNDASDNDADDAGDDDDDDDDDMVGDQHRAFALMASLQNNAAALAQAPPGYVDAASLFPSVEDEAAALPMAPQRRSFRAALPSVPAPGPQTLARPLPAPPLPALAQQPSPQANGNNEADDAAAPDQGGVAEMDTDPPISSTPPTPSVTINDSDVGDWSLPMPARSPQQELDDLVFDGNAQVPTPGVGDWLNEADVFDEAPLQLGPDDAQARAKAEQAESEARAFAEIQQLLAGAGAYDADNDSELFMPTFDYQTEQLTRMQAQQRSVLDEADFFVFGNDNDDDAA